MRDCGVTKDKVYDREEWKCKIEKVDPDRWEVVMMIVFLKS